MFRRDIGEWSEWDERPAYANALRRGRHGRSEPDWHSYEGPLSEEMLKTRLGSYGAAELLNQLQWDTYPEKILILGAWHEARGGGTPWKSSDMEAVFRQAKEAPPSNFPRDIKAAIKAGGIHTHTPRTYSVTRTGWNRVAEAVSKAKHLRCPVAFLHIKSCRYQSFRRRRRKF
jgi:hypothetical protein